MSDSDFDHPFSRTEGRRAFGSDPVAYERARPAYPARIYELVEQRCGLSPGTATLEIGPGPGVATRELLARGAGPLVLVEPDARLAGHLEAWLVERKADATLHVCAFEDAELEPGSFDLAVAATAFHWTPQRPGLAKLVGLLRPGGWSAMWWMVFGDAARPDPFHDATTGLLEQATAHEQAPWPPFSLCVEQRTADLAGAGFRDIRFDPIYFSLRFTSQEIRELYASFSPISRIPEAPRDRLLDDLAGVAEREFGGIVERPIIIACYTAQRPE